MPPPKPSSSSTAPADPDPAPPLDTNDNSHLTPNTIGMAAIHKVFVTLVTLPPSI